MKFSVLMSVYKNDNPIFLREAFESIITQTLLPNEIVLVKDGPVGEKLARVISELELQSSLLKVIESKENIGLGRALQLGMKFCSYDIIARMDSDDICSKDRFEKQINYFIEDEELSIVGSNISEFETNKENIIGSRIVPIDDDDIKKYLKVRCPLNHVTVMFRKEHVERVGGYMHWHYNEDYYLWIRMVIGKCKFKNINDTLVYVRVGSDMYKRRGGIEYFKSEEGIQRLMLQKKIINIFEYIRNVLLRLVVQVLIPNKVRGLIFKKVFRREV